MSQNAIALPLVGVYSGTQAATYINNALDTVETKQSGAGAPSGPALGWDWLDTSVANYATWKVYDGSAWCAIGTLDEANDRWVPVVGGGSATIASAATTDLWDSTSNKAHSTNVIISGVTPITSFGATVTVGALVHVTHSGILTLTHNAVSLILPTGASITTAVGDTYIALCIAAGNYRVLAYQKADGTPLVYSGTVTGSFALSGILAPGALGADQNDYNPGSLATASMLELTSSVATVNITGLAGGSAGRIINIRNANALAGGKIFRFPAEATGSSAANRFSAAADVTLRPGEERMFKYDTSGALNRWIPQGHISGSGAWASFKNLKITSNGAQTTATITIDEVILEDADGNTLRLTTVSQSPNVGAAAGAGAIDTGTSAINTWYSIWIIYNPATSTVSAIFSLNATAPMTPSGYTFKARVGWAKTDGTGSKFLLGFNQYGRRTQYIVATGTNVTATPFITTSTGGATWGAAVGLKDPGAGAASTVSWVPATAGRAVIMASNQGANNFAGLAPSTSYGAGASLTNPPPIQAVGVGAAAAGTVVLCDLTLESTSIYTQGSNGNFFCYGWEDNI